MTASNNEITETVDLLYKITNLLSEYKHIEQYLSKEFITTLDKELLKFVEAENKILNE